MSCYIIRDKSLCKSWFHKLPAFIQRGSDAVVSSLCLGCDSLDLLSIVARMRTHTYVSHIALPPWSNSAGTPATDSACALCALFTANWDPEGEIQVRWMESLYFGKMEEFSPSPAAVVFYNRNWTELAVFEIIPSRDNHLDPVSHLLDLNSIDFDRIRLWLQSCSKADLALQPHEKTDYLPGFRLIHCRSRKITEPSQSVSTSHSLTCGEENYQKSHKAGAFRKLSKMPSGCA